MKANEVLRMIEIADPAVIEAGQRYRALRRTRTEQGVVIKKGDEVETTSGTLRDGKVVRVRPIVDGEIDPHEGPYDIRTVDFGKMFKFLGYA